VQRKIIMGTLQNLDMHPTAEELFGAIVQEHPIVGKSTVYRNLRQMCDDKTLLCFAVNGAMRYDKNTHMHHHYICDDCGKIYDIEIDTTGLNTLVEQKYGPKVRTHEIGFYGTCIDCQSTVNRQLGQCP